MQLKLLIDLTSARNRTFNIDVFRNHELVDVDLTSFEIDVVDCDTVRIVATGKENGTVVSDDGEILEDISLNITGIFLAGVKIADHYSMVTAYDAFGNKLPTAASLYCDGALVIDVNDLVHTHFDYSGVEVLTLDQISREVLG